MMNDFYITSEYKYISGKNGNVIKKHKISNRIFSFCVAVSVEKGSFFVEINNELFNVKQGETVFVPSFVPHAVGTDEDSVVTYAHFHCSYLNMDVFRFTKKACIISRNEQLCNILMQMNDSALNEGFLGKILADRAICDVVLTLQSENSLCVKLDETDTHLYKVLNYINQNISRGVDTAEIIAENGYKKTNFYKIFTEKMNMTPHEYLERERMKLATLMLAEGKKVKDIATIVGYNDESYFIKKFKKVVGKTPTQYRKSMEELLYGTEKSR